MAQAPAPLAVALCIFAVAQVEPSRLGFRKVGKGGGVRVGSLGLRALFVFFGVPLGNTCCVVCLYQMAR